MTAGPVIHVARPPAIFVGLAWSLPVLITGQVFLAGLSIFSDASVWEVHAGFGGVLALPILALLGLSWTRIGLAGFRRATLSLLVLYSLQFVFLAAGEALGNGFVQALHPANAMVIAAVSGVVAIRSTR